MVTRQQLHRCDTAETSKANSQFSNTSRTHRDTQGLFTYLVTRFQASYPKTSTNTSRGTAGMKPKLMHYLDLIWQTTAKGQLQSLSTLAEQYVAVCSRSALLKHKTNHDEHRVAKCHQQHGMLDQVAI
jgi:hypothetical protein